jgi:hypothetical protein
MTIPKLQLCTFACQLQEKSNQTLISLLPPQSPFNISLALESCTASWGKWTLRKDIIFFLPK